MSRITVTTKVSEEESERLKDRAREKGMSLSGYLKSLCNKDLEQGGAMEDQLNEIAFLYDIDGENLVKNVRWLLDSGKLFTKEGKLCWNPKATNPEYVSVDEAIDGLKAPEWKKNKYKQDILKSLNLDRNDDTGNGGGL